VKVAVLQGQLYRLGRQMVVAEELGPQMAVAEEQEELVVAVVQGAAVVADVATNFPLLLPLMSAGW
jgi:hypothetical protein